MEEQADNTSGNVLVICRFRPLNPKELEMSETLCMEITPDSKNLKILSQYEYGDPLKFGFDYIFGPDSKQSDVYSVSARPIVEAVMQGFNGTVFAYGQTSSGKTFTMTGPDVEDVQSMGIIPRMVSTVFNEIADSDPLIEYTVKVSYCEIYMEKIRDLLDVTKENLKVHEDRTRGVFIAELTEQYVANDYEVYNIMKFGMENRNVGATNMNAVSSRSHALFLITISQTNKRDYIAKTGKLYLIDLAGSEKVGKTNVVGKRLEEAKNINKSLTMLGLVIYSLTDGKSTHIPYRDSKLTRVLQDSLGGNSKTALIITCSPSSYNEAETISTLRFGMRAKAIKNTPKINREYSVAELKLMLAKCREEVVKRDKRIKTLEEALFKLGARVPAQETLLEPNGDNEDYEQEQGQEEVKNVDNIEIIAELEDTRTKLQEEVRISSKLRVELALRFDELNHQKAAADVSSRKLAASKERLMELEKICNEKENLVEKLSITKESLEKEVHIVNTKLIDLERELSEKNAELQRRVKYSDSGKSKRSAVEEMGELLKKERDINAAAQREIAQLRQNLSDILNKKCPESKVQEIMRDEISRKERDKWVEEKKSLIKELQIRVDRIVELEMTLDDSKESYSNLESCMSQGERALKRKTDTLERNLEQLTLMYHQLITQKSQVQVEKKLADKKLLRVTDKVKEIEDEAGRFKTLYEQYKDKLDVCEEELRKAIASRERRMTAQSGNIMKTIQGGRNHGRVHSVLGNSYSHEE